MNHSESGNLESHKFLKKCSQNLQGNSPVDVPFLVVPVSLESTVQVSWHSPPVALSSEVPPVQVPALEGEAVPMVWLGPPKR